MLVRIEDSVSFAPNYGVIVEKKGLQLSKEKLYEIVHLAFSHLTDKCWMDELFMQMLDEQQVILPAYYITYERYLQLQQEAEWRRTASEAKKFHIKRRRNEYRARRSGLILAMLDQGIPYVCAQTGCDAHVDLTIDHITPISLGGTDDLSNLRFLCMHHNGIKGDRRDEARAE